MTIHQFIRWYPFSEITEGIDVPIVVGRLGSCGVAMLVNLIARPTALIARMISTDWGLLDSLEMNAWSIFILSNGNACR